MVKDVTDMLKYKDGGHIFWNLKRCRGCCEHKRQKSKTKSIIGWVTHILRYRDEFMFILLSTFSFYSGNLTREQSSFTKQNNLNSIGTRKRLSYLFFSV